MVRYRSIQLLTALLLLSNLAAGQQFDRADSYNVSNCNEVAALTTDARNNAYISGVYGASPFLPYTGNCYLLKANAEGTMLWIKYFTGLVQIGDIVISGDGLWIAGQSNGLFTYDGISYGLPAYHMFLLKTDTAGVPVLMMTDDSRNGASANLEAGDDAQVLVHSRGVSNTGNYIELLAPDGYVIRDKEISGSSAHITDIAFHNDRVYLNGGFNGSDSLVIDNIVIHQPAIEHAAFVLALDEELVADWVSTDTTINNRDGQIVAGYAGVYASMPVLEPPFTTVNVVKHFSFDGQLVREREIPFFTTSVTLYPDMAIAPGVVGIFASNDFNHDNHEVILFDENLNLLDELSIAGLSDLYSGQIAASGNGFLIAHVHSGDLNFDNAFILPYSGTGKRPYTASLSYSEPTGWSAHQFHHDEVNLYPNPANQTVFIEVPSGFTGSVLLTIADASGRTMLRESLQSGVNRIDTGNLFSGTYVVSILMPDGIILRKKLMIT